VSRRVLVVAIVAVLVVVTATVVIAVTNRVAAQRRFALSTSPRLISRSQLLMGAPYA
jgi:hypothetical protein